MLEQDQRAGEMEESEIVLHVIFPANDKATRVMKPGKEALDLPASLRSAQRTSVLGRDLPRRAMSGDHFNPPRPHQGRIEAIAVVGLITDQPRREVLAEPGVEGVFDEPDLGRRSAGHVDGEGRPWPSQIAMTLLPLPRLVGPIAEPLFSPR